MGLNFINFLYFLTFLFLLSGNIDLLKINKNK